LLTLAVLSGCGTAAMHTAGGSWYEVRSPRFALWTDGEPERARALVADLERFHAVMLAMTTAEDRLSAPPLRIFLAKDRASFLAWTRGHMKSAAGFFKSSGHGNYAVIDPGPHDGGGIGEFRGREVLFHEYTHYITTMHGVRAPSWYDEGFAEYMAPTEFRASGAYTVGCPSLYRTAGFSYAEWLSMGAVMEANNIATLMRDPSGGVRTAHAAIDTYAQSWYAVHFFSADEVHQHQLVEYLRLWGLGTPPSDAVRRAFGMDYPTLDKVLRAYAANPRFACIEVMPAQPLPTPRIEVRPMSTADAHRHVGDLLEALFGPIDAALDILLKAAALAPRDASTLAALARWYWQSARAPGASPADAFVRARRYLDQAIAIAPDNPEVLTLDGHLRSEAAAALFKAGKLGTVELEAARNAYRRAIHRDDTAAEAYYGLGVTYLIQDSGAQEAVVVFEEAAYLLPLETGISMDLARLYIGRKDSPKAIAALEDVEHWSKSEPMVAAAKKLHALLNNAPNAPPAVAHESSPAAAQAGPQTPQTGP
jgi:Flp pilus assembly protein TadD